MSPTLSREELLIKLGSDRIMAHQALFPHRHSNTTPAFHNEIIDIWHANDKAALVMVFREGGKSTIAEEAFVVGAGFQLFHNALIIGSTERRACERLRAIKHEIEHNEMVSALFGDLVGPVWNEAEVILSNGVRIIAVGRGQSLRGTKHLHYRPDFCFCDDIEEEENVRTPEAREETLSWFMSTVLPALDIDARIRVNATPLDREALPYKLQHQLKWPTRVYPIEHVDGQGVRRATWPSRYTLEWIDATRAAFAATGRMTEYMREYMCVAEDPSKKIFTAEMFVTEHHTLTWQPVYAMFDPARTIKQTSSLTGWAVWSYAPNRKIVVWDGGGSHWSPAEIVDKIFQVEGQYRPVAIGVERDGLEEFLLQPLRSEALRRAIVLPLSPLRAPRGKLDFISALEPHFKAREIVFAKDLPELRAQFLSYPSGQIDGPNALAYALTMRPTPVYDTFGHDHVVDAPEFNERERCWLALNAAYGYVTGVLIQIKKGLLRVIADFVAEGDVGAVEGVITDALAVSGGAKVHMVAPAHHFGRYDTLGLRAAVAKFPAALMRGGDLAVGRIEIRALLEKRVGGIPGLVVPLGSSACNAMAGGYCYDVNRDGSQSAEPRENVYRCLLEGLETFAATLRHGALTDDTPPNYQYTSTGRRFISALPGKGVPHEAKDEYPLPDDNRSSARTLLRR